MKQGIPDLTVFKLIEARLILDGSVTSNVIYRSLGLGRQSVSKLFTKYQAENPNSMTYMPGKRRYVATDSFRAIYLDCRAGEYLDALQVVFGTFEETTE